MKVRKGFVSNSSSSSFVVISAGNEVLFRDGDDEMEEYGAFSVQIDEMIALLQAAKEKGAVTVDITHGGGYEG